MVKRAVVDLEGTANVLLLPCLILTIFIAVSPKTIAVSKLRIGFYQRSFHSGLTL